MTAAVWALYVPQLSVLRALGPRLGPLWARTVGRLHWLLTFVGAQNDVRQWFQTLYPQFRTSLSVSDLVRKHLVLKHECFARTKISEWQKNKSSSDGITWVVDPELTAAFERARRSGRGLIIVGYHLGF